MTFPVIPIRWQRDAPRVGRTLLIDPNHPLAGTACAHCESPMRPGTHWAIVAVGPGSDVERQERHDEGRWYPADGVLCHAGPCAAALDPATLAGPEGET